MVNIAKTKPTSKTPQRDRVQDLDARGLTVRQIAAALSISTQRVYQHLRKIRMAEAEPEEAAS